MFVGDIKRCFDNPSYGTDDWQLNLLGNIVEVDNRIKHSAFPKRILKRTWLLHCRIIIQMAGGDKIYLVVFYCLHIALTTQIATMHALWLESFAW